MHTLVRNQYTVPRCGHLAATNLVDVDAPLPRHLEGGNGSRHRRFEEDPRIALSFGSHKQMHTVNTTAVVQRLSVTRGVEVAAERSTCSSSCLSLVSGQMKMQRAQVC